MELVVCFLYEVFFTSNELRLVCLAFREEIGLGDFVWGLLVRLELELRGFGLRMRMWDERL